MLSCHVRVDNGATLKGLPSAFRSRVSLIEDIYQNPDVKNPTK
jgi:hypothetical protein|tara:strand:+ start:517 stop:645 length:129 start_codon:yes stop_codon:yes gene_type:complete